MRVMQMLVGWAMVAAIGGPACGSEPDAADSAGADSSGDSMETVMIVTEREARTSKGATGLELSLADTPQSETVIDSEAIETFGLTDINSMLRLATGVNVESAETDRTYYNSRGFDITSMQVDGVGMPFDNLIVGDIDTALYDKVEIVRGANGLLTGIGNPSGTINYVRKRPTNDLLANADLTYGSWNLKRVETDVSTPLTSSGAWAARVVGVFQDKDYRSAHKCRARARPATCTCRRSFPCTPGASRAYPAAS